MLEKASKHFTRWLVTEQGSRFRGVVQPLDEGSISITAFTEPRHVLRLSEGDPVQVGDIIVDPMDRRFLVAEHDYTPFGRVHKLFRMTDRVSWKRPVTTTDMVTGLSRVDANQELGPIWVAVELYGREEVDRSSHIGMDRSRIIAGPAIRLNDLIDDRMVRRLVQVYGIWIAEVQ